jgi:hypothetical protein
MPVCIAYGSQESRTMFQTLYLVTFISFHIISSLLHHHNPEQIPFGLDLHQLPNKINSWLICSLPKQPQEMQWSDHKHEAASLLV